MTGSEPANGGCSDPRPVSPQDWGRVQQLYAFCLTRAIDRIAAAQQRHPATTSRERRDQRVLEMMYGEARQHEGIVASCAVTYFRAKAMKDAQHPEFLGEWI